MVLSSLTIFVLVAVCITIPASLVAVGLGALNTVRTQNQTPVCDSGEITLYVDAGTGVDAIGDELPKLLAIEQVINTCATPSDDSTSGPILCM